MQSTELSLHVLRLTLVLSRCKVLSLLFASCRVIVPIVDTVYIMLNFGVYHFETYKIIISYHKDTEWLVDVLHNKSK